MSKPTRERMINLCFRTDQVLIDLFHQECKIESMTRSEAFRKIFNEYMFNKYFKEKKDGKSINSSSVQ